MKQNKMYEADDKMISLIADNYNIVQGLGCFGISLGFGDKTVREVCESQNVDTYTFLTVVNFSINGLITPGSVENLSIPTLLHYLQASHDYHLKFQLPRIREELNSALDENDNLAKFIMKLYDGYAYEIKRHMKLEERTVFPYVEDLLKGTINDNYDIDTFSQHHNEVGQKLTELKNIIIKYLPVDRQHNNRLTATLYNIYNNEEWLLTHAKVEDHIFIPAVRKLEKKYRQSDISVKISKMIGKGRNVNESLSEREKDVIISLVQGMSNKEIAEHLFISTNTVITHRRNIARKLQIHSPAGLTIFAIVNNLIDISDVRI